MNQHKPMQYGTNVVLAFLLMVLFSFGCATTTSHKHVKKPSQTKQLSEAVYGRASWYGRGFHGRKTASGEKFHMHGYTTAHRTLPFGTVLIVTNMANNQKVTVRVNDRGPFIKGRILDLSFAAAKELGFVAQGFAEIKYQIVQK